MPFGRRCLVPVSVLVATMAMVVGCGGGSEEPSWVQDLSDDASEQIQPSLGEDGDEGEERAATSTGGTTVPATAAVDTPPPVELTGTDLDAVWRSMQAYEEWVLAHPDPALLDKIYVEGTEIHSQAVDLVTELRDAGAHMVVGGYEILDVEVVEQRPGEGATVRYVDRRATREVVDAAGTVVEREEFGDEAFRWELTLDVDDDGNWQIAGIEFVETAA